MTSHMFVLAIPLVAIVAVFTFVTIASWAESRTKEREAFYHAELLKKVAESTGESAQQVLAIMREEQQTKERQRLEGQRLSGLVTLLVGIGVCIMLANIAGDRGIWTVGLIPAFVGLAILLKTYVFTPRAVPGAPEAR